MEEYDRRRGWPKRLGVEVEGGRFPHELLGQEVSVRVPGSEEILGAEILGTLEEIRDDGVVLSHIGELESGITMFVPRGAIRRITPRSALEEMTPSVSQPTEEPYPGETPTLEPPQRARPSARTLDRVVPVAQRQTVGEITVTLTSLELYEGRLGVLRYRLSYNESTFQGWDERGFMPEPEFVIRDGSGLTLGWSPRSAGGGGGEDSGSVEVWDLPEVGELEVEVARVTSGAWNEEQGPSYDGPWTFRFSI